ncbi:hypothetical protein B0H13DRAFT_1873599 [Mycena leptocephala]|nr:hypothetical protein B0H13DRAFT_1873599 [Mycena leptocephala]
MYRHVFHFAPLARLLLLAVLWACTFPSVTQMSSLTNFRPSDPTTISPPSQSTLTLSNPASAHYAQMTRHISGSRAMPMNADDPQWPPTVPKTYYNERVASEINLVQPLGIFKYYSQVK